MLINWLSGIWAPAAPVVIVLALISLPLLAKGDGSRLDSSPSLAWIASLKRDGLLELCLAALVLGFAVACISLIPVWPTATFKAPYRGDALGFDGHALTTNYEVGTVAVIVLMVTVAAYRAPSVRRQTAFLVCAFYGVAVAYTFLRPQENAFLPTFVGNFVTAAILTALIAALPRMVVVVKSFWGLGNQVQSQTAAQTLRGANDPRRSEETQD